MRIIDTHCHLNDPSFEKRLLEVLKRAEVKGVSDIIVPSYDLESLKRTSEIAEGFNNIHPAYGIHPWYIEESLDLAILNEYITSNKTIAIGEIGLDYAEDVKTPLELQRRIFIEQIELASTHNLPVLIHCRRAHQDMLSILKSYNGKIKGIMHSFSGSRELMEKFLDLGMYISFSGAVTRSHAKKYHKNAVAVPAERILFETDAPSISTQTIEASNVEPCHIVEIIHFVANLRGIDYEDMARISTENAIRLFGEGPGE